MTKILLCHIAWLFCWNAGADVVGHWRFDSGAGMTMKDLSAKGNDGVIEGGQVRGGSLELDGWVAMC